MILTKVHLYLLAFTLWILGWIITYVFLGFIAVNHGLIVFVWPVYELVVYVFHAAPSDLATRIAIAVFIGLIWFPLPLGIVKRRIELIILPFCIMYGTWLPGLIWGHVHAVGI